MYCSFCLYQRWQHTPGDCAFFILIQGSILREARLANKLFKTIKGCSGYLTFTDGESQSICASRVHSSVRRILHLQLLLNTTAMQITNQPVIHPPSDDTHLPEGWAAPLCVCMLTYNTHTGWLADKQSILMWYRTFLSKDLFLQTFATLKKP